MHRIPLPRTPCHQRGPETRPGQDETCARNAAAGHQSSQKILWIRQLLSKVYAETKAWVALETKLRQVCFDDQKIRQIPVIS